MDIVKKIKKVRILVIGDVILDRYWWGNVSRISPEAPVPVVALEKTSLALGGAANVAANVAALGATPILLGLSGKDPEAATLARVLDESKIVNRQIFPIKGRKTALKTRVIAHNQQVVRIDHETIEPLSPKDEARITKAAQSALEHVDLVVFSDYGKGFLSESILSELIAYAKSQNKMALVDPKGKNYSKYAGATILTPNQHETADACGIHENDPGLIEVAAKSLLKDLSLAALLITQGEKGMTLLQSGKKPSKLLASACKVFDVTGAGDTVIATLGAALGAGMSFLDAASIANAAAGLAVESVGTTSVTAEELRSVIG
jgi:D-beta-D-heptose 7-phosphate kinase/D-beta-D-heptose 1-phosphate adenosyltransferase